MDDLRALSVRQPWAHAIVHLGKDIENRSRKFRHRGPTLIHASAGLDRDEYEFASGFIADIAGPFQIPSLDQMKRGGIIGIAEVVNCVDGHPSKWWMGPCGLMLANARALPFIPCKGTVTPLFWMPDADVQSRVRVALSQMDWSPAQARSDATA